MLHAQAALAVHDGDTKTAKDILTGNCFPTYGNDRVKLINLWLECFLKEEQKKKGRNLTLLETVHVRRRLGCDGDMSSVEHATASRFNADGTFVSEPSSCTNGPPNLGYPY